MPKGYMTSCNLENRRLKYIWSQKTLCWMCSTWPICKWSKSNPFFIILKTKDSTAQEGCEIRAMYIGSYYVIKNFAQKVFNSAFLFLLHFFQNWSIKSLRTNLKTFVWRRGFVQESVYGCIQTFIGKIMNDIIVILCTFLYFLRVWF